MWQTRFHGESIVPLCTVASDCFNWYDFNTAIWSCHMALRPRHTYCFLFLLYVFWFNDIANFRPFRCFRGAYQFKWDDTSHLIGFSCWLLDKTLEHKWLFKYRVAFRMLVETAKYHVWLTIVANPNRLDLLTIVSKSTFTGMVIQQPNLTFQLHNDWTS